MTDRIENVLRDTLEQRSAAVPPLPDLMDGVARRRVAQRRRNRTVLSAAAVALVVAGTVTAAVTLTGKQRPTAAPPPPSPTIGSTPTQQPRLAGVPFAPIAPGPATTYNPWPTTDVRTRMCTSADLRIHVVAGQTIGTATQMQLAAQSVSHHVCRLDRNTISLGVAASRTGSLLDAGQRGGIQPFWAAYPRVDPGAIVILDASWTNWCGARLAHAYPVVRANQTIAIRAVDAVRPPGCIDPAQGSATSIEFDTIGAPGSILSAVPAVHAPATVRAGSILRYQLTLTNPTDTTIALRPCPSYIEEFGNLGDGRDPYRSTATYRLNCPATPTIASHATITFQMQIPIPAKDKGLSLTLGWYWRGGDHTVLPQGTPHQATVRVTS